MTRRFVVLALIAAAIASAQVSQIPGSTGGPGGSGTIASTTNIITGDGAGNGANSGIAPANVVQTSGTASATLTTALGIGSGAPVTGGIYVNDVNNVTNNQWAEFDCNNNGTTTTRCGYNFRKGGFLNWSLTNDPSGFFGLNQYNNATGAFLNNIWAANASQSVFYNNAGGTWKFVFGLAATDASGATVQVGTNGLSANKMFAPYVILSLSSTDVALSRNAAGIAEINNGAAGPVAAGSVRDLRVRHEIASGTAPTSSQGTVAGSDEAGRITFTAGAASFTVTFGTAYTTNAPSCVVNSEDNNHFGVSVVATTSGFTATPSSGSTDTGWLNAGKANWLCKGY